MLANKLDVKVAEADLPAVLTLALPGGGIATTECRGDSTGGDFKRQLVPATNMEPESDDEP